MDTCDTGIILVDGPSGSGKTRYIKKLGSTQANTLTSEQLTDALLQMCKQNSSLQEIAATLQHIAFFENMESLHGRQETQRLAAQLIALMAEKRRITLTGIDFRRRLPYFLDALNAHGTDYTWKAVPIAAEA